MIPTRFAHFAASDPAGSDLPFWDQKVYFDGAIRRRREVAPTLAHTPGMNEPTARLILLGAKIAGGEELATPPLAWFADKPGEDLDPEGRWITISGNHCHINRHGEIDAGGPPAIRTILAKRGGGTAPKAPAGSDAAGHVAQALRDWGANRAYIDGKGNYRLKSEGKSTGKVAPWNKEAKKHFKDVSDLHEAASALKGQTGSGKPLKAPHPDVDLFSRVAREVAKTGLKQKDQWDGQSSKGKVDPASPLHQLAIQAGYSEADLQDAVKNTLADAQTARHFRAAVKKAERGDFGPELKAAVERAKAGGKSKAEKPKVGEGGESEADVDARYARGKAMRDELVQKGKLAVETPEGKKFTIHHKMDDTFGMAHGYAIQEPGKKIGKHMMLGADEVHGWLGKLKKQGDGAPAPEAAPEVTPQAAPEGANNGHWSIDAARYAKGKVAITPRSDGLKSGAAAIAEALGGKWTDREKAYILPKTKENRFIALSNGGWESSPIMGTLTPPKAVGADAGTKLGQAWAKVQAALDGHAAANRSASDSEGRDYSAAYKAGAEATNLHKEFTKMVASGKFDVDLGIKAGKPTAASKAAAKAGNESRAAATATPPPPANPDSGGAHIPALTPAEEKAHAERMEKLAFKPGPIQKVTSQNLVRDMKRANEQSAKFDFLAGPAKSGFTGDMYYFAKMPEKGKERDAIMKASQAHVQSGVTNGGKQVPYEESLQTYAGRTSDAVAKITGHRVSPQDDSGKTFHTRVEDSEGNGVTLRSHQLAAIQKLWPDASMHIAIRKGYGSTSKTVVFKHAGKPVAVAMGFSDE